MATTKHFKTAKEDETAPKLNNASIYRAGQNPNKQENDSNDENDEDIITNSYFLAEQLKCKQQATFVDALKHRRDASGRIITKSQILHRNNKKKQKSLKSKSPQQSMNNNNNLNNNNIASSQSIKNDKHEKEDDEEMKREDNDSWDESDESDSDSSDDFDMNNLTVPKVENIENTTTKNESDDVREKFKQRLLLQKQEELDSAPIIVKTDKMDINITDDDDDNDDDDDESESEYETDSSSDDEEEERRHPRNRKIVFLNKKQRDEHYENVNKPSLDEEAQILEQMEEERQQKLKQQTTEDVLNYIRDQEKQERERGDKSDEEMPDDNDDDFDGEEGRKEFELWKLREIKRNLRDEIIRSEREKEKEELLRRRKMTDDEIMAENKKMGLNKEKKNKTKPKFMQKYYHSGVFYRDGSIVDDGVLDRNFNAPTGQDKYIDFEKVPNAMKTKNFGKMSQSKWTHLANEDTTFDKEEREWFKKRNNMNDEQRKKYEINKYQFRHKAHENNFWFKRGGSGSFDRPSHKKGNVDDGNKRFERKYKSYDTERGRSKSSERRSKKRRR